MDRPGLFPLAAIGLIVGSVVVMLLLNDDGGDSRASETTTTTPARTFEPAPPPPPSPVANTTTITTTDSIPGAVIAATEVTVLDGWEDLEAPFGQRWNPGVAWTGDELLLWGGSGQRRFDASANALPTNTGFRYDPAEDSWQQMADSELCPMTEVGSAWTEGAFTTPELVVWPAGATQRTGDCRLYGAYDPATDSWRYLEDDYFVQFFSRVGGGSSVVWTGELLVAPSTGLALDPIDGPLLDIPDVPRNADDGVFSARIAHWTGEEVLVLGSDELFSWSGDEWIELPSPPITERARGSAWDGDELVAVNYELEAARWDGEEWTRVESIPLRFYECVPRGVSSDDVLALEWCGPFAVWDAGRELFVPVPGPVDWSSGNQAWRGGDPYASAEALYVIGDGVFRYELDRDPEDRLELPASMPIGVHFLDITADLDLSSAAGLVSETVDQQSVAESLSFRFETLLATCFLVSTYLGEDPPPGTSMPAILIASRTGEVVGATEYDNNGSFTIRLPSRNGSDVVDVSCGERDTTRQLAQQLWEPEY